jgi:phospholipase/carboxylesterase
LRNTPLLSAIAYPDPYLKTPLGLLVVLHGWGANAADLAGLVPYLDLKNYQFLLPDAPFPHPDVPGGRMWYNLYDISTRAGLEESRHQLTQWLQSLESSTGISLQQTILAGFSQGGAMALDVGIHLPLAGLISFSGYLHPTDICPLPTPPMSPILITHGKQDLVVPLSEAHHARKQLTEAGASVAYHEYDDMGHEITPAVLKATQQFIQDLGS